MLEFSKVSRQDITFAGHCSNHVALGDASDLGQRTFEHMYGETTIEQAPERIATWGWGATDAVLALGIVAYGVALWAMATKPA